MIDDEPELSRRGSLIVRLVTFALVFAVTMIGRSLIGAG